MLNDLGIDFGKMCILSLLVPCAGKLDCVATMGDAFFGASLKWGALFILRFHIDILDMEEQVLWDLIINQTKTMLAFSEQ